jgi:hypothetical protein
MLTGSTAVDHCVVCSRSNDSVSTCRYISVHNLMHGSTRHLGTAVNLHAHAADDYPTAGLNSIQEV